jgi:hypothetical protein
MECNRGKKALAEMDAVVVQFSHPRGFNDSPKLDIGYEV